jgi:hypothetical protein
LRARAVGWIGNAIAFVSLGIFFGGIGFIWGDVFFGLPGGIVFGLITFVIAGWVTVRITDRISLGFLRLIQGREKVDAAFGLGEPNQTGENAEGGNSTDNTEEPEQQDAPTTSQAQATDVVQGPVAEEPKVEQAKDSEQTIPLERVETSPEPQTSHKKPFREIYAEANPETGEFLAQAGTKRLRVNADTLEIWTGILKRPYLERSIEIENISRIEVSGVYSYKMQIYDEEGNEFMKVNNLWKRDAKKIEERLGQRTKE